MEPTLAVIGLNHRTAPIAVRERFWMDEARREHALTSLLCAEGISEVLVFSTCRRTEFVVWGDPTLAGNSVLRFLTAEYGLTLCEWKSFYRLLDEQALAHAFRVSCGLDSMCIGEGQIARQVNAAWQQARAAGATGPVLDSLLQKALAVRRRVRKETAIAECFVSTTQATVELVSHLFGSLTRRRVLLLGAGRMAEAVAQSLAGQGASVCVINRTDQHATRLARKVGAQACSFDAREKLLVSADLVIGTMASTQSMITAAEMAEVAGDREQRNLVLIDLGLPRNIDPAVRDVGGMLLYDLDDLERAQGHRSEVWEAEVEAEKIILGEAQAFRKELVGEAAAPAIADLRHRLEEICQQELDSFRLEQGPFPKDQDQLLTAVSTRITHKIAGSLARRASSHL